jgi:hypothetical protein
VITISENNEHDKNYCNAIDGKVITKDDEEFCEYKIDVDFEDEEIDHCNEIEGKVIKKDDEVFCEFKID